MSCLGECLQPAQEQQRRTTDKFVTTTVDLSSLEPVTRPGDGAAMGATSKGDGHREEKCERESQRRKEETDRRGGSVADWCNFNKLEGQWVPRTVSWGEN